MRAKWKWLWFSNLDTLKYFQYVGYKYCHQLLAAWWSAINILVGTLERKECLWNIISASVAGGDNFVILLIFYFLKKYWWVPWWQYRQPLSCHSYWSHIALFIYMEGVICLAFYTFPTAKVGVCIHSIKLKKKKTVVLFVYLFSKEIFNLISQHILYNLSFDISKTSCQIRGYNVTLGWWKIYIGGFEPRGITETQKKLYARVCSHIAKWCMLNSYE